ncbi:MAG: peptide chain release factor N(5)-glutamine methyltransferase [Clostridia bacterium]
MTINETLSIAINKLKESNIAEPISKARLILAFVLCKQKEYLITHDKEITLKKDFDKYMSYIDRLLENEPIQHILGCQEFMKLNFKVNKNVLIPRQDTEVLVEEVIMICSNMENAKILDLCTGSGAIAISLSKYLNKAKVYATDISDKALEVASFNNENLKTGVQFINSNLFQNIDLTFDIIVSNPPYIKSSDIMLLSKDVQKEPIIALDGGEDGLEFYRKIINEAYKFLNPKGYLCLEIGYDQKEAVIKLIEKTGKYFNIYSKKDLENNDRIVICKKRGE